MVLPPPPNSKKRVRKHLSADALYALIGDRFARVPDPRRPGFSYGAELISPPDRRSLSREAGVNRTAIIVSRAFGAKPPCTRLLCLGSVLQPDFMAIPSAVSHFLNSLRLFAPSPPPTCRFLPQCPVFGLKS
jgi:hypothetical protein